jgi:hypothetical protein
MAAPTAATPQPDSFPRPSHVTPGKHRHTQCTPRWSRGDEINRRPKSAPPRIPVTMSDSASLNTSWRSQNQPQCRTAGNCICKPCLYCDRHKQMPMNEKCTKCCPLLQTAEVSYAVTMKLIDDQLQIMEKKPTKTSQHINEVVTDSNTVPSTTENPPLIDAISTHYHLNMNTKPANCSKPPPECTRQQESLLHMRTHPSQPRSEANEEHVAPWRKPSPRGPPPKSGMHAESDTDSASDENSDSDTSNSDGSTASDNNIESPEGSDSAGSSDTDGSDDQ